ncbi:hypothetical protein BJ165DRAFT_1519828 [Panaeolus papilionaceus]|nr:hypothetical protein BJ165DRAFT_1519828 [Panaeolus papilionaceus]
MLYTILAVLTLLISGANSQATRLSGDEYTWGFNSLGQSPCHVASRLLSICVGGPVTVAALKPNAIYAGAQEGGGGSDCRCSSVYYSMLSACAQCQGRAWLDWPDQIYWCKDVYHQYLPFSVPLDFQVPSWAYIDIASLNIFNLDAARNSIRTTSDPPTPRPTRTPTPTPRTTPTPSPNSPDVAPTSTPGRTNTNTSSDSSTLRSNSPSPSSRTTSGTTTLVVDAPVNSDDAPFANSPSNSSNGAPDAINANGGGSVSASGNPAPVGAILGGIVGSMAVIAFLILGLLWMRRKSQYEARLLNREQMGGSGVIGGNDDTVPPAYTVSPHTTGTSGLGSSNPFFTSGKGRVEYHGGMGSATSPMLSGSRTPDYSNFMDPDSGLSVAGTAGNRTTDWDEQMRQVDAAPTRVLSPVRGSINKF